MLTKARKLAIYRRTLARYEAEGDTEKAAIQRRMIEWMESKDGK